MAEVKKVTLKRFNGTDDDTLHPTTEWEQVENKPSTFTPTAHSLNSHTDVDANPTADGQVLTWDATNNQWISADSAGGGSVSKLDLQNVYIYGKADGAITIGQAVQFAGVEGDHILIKPAVPSEINAEPTLMIGIAETTLADNDFGYVIVNGRLNLDTSTYTAGDLLYFASAGSTAGALTTTEPTDPNASIQMAAVSIDGVGNGEFIIRNTILTRQINEVIGLQGALDSKVDKSGDTMTGNLAIENGAPQLTLKDTTDSDDINLGFLNNANSQVANISTVGNRLNINTTFSNGLIIDAEKVGIGTTSPSRKLHIQSGTNDIGLVVESSDQFAKISLKDNATTSDAQVMIVADGNDMFLEAGSSERIRIKADGKVGIGTTSPSEKLSVSGNIAVSGTVDGVDIAAFKSSYDSHNHNTLYYTKAQTDANIAAIVDSSPATLDTLNELAAALGDDPNFATTVSNSIGTKVSKSGDTMTGNLTMGSNLIYGDGTTRYLNLGGSPAELVTVRSMEIRADDDDSSNTEYLKLMAGQNTLQVTSTSGGGTDNSKLTYNGNKVFHDGYHPNADKLTTARNIALTGDVSGNANFDGSGNISISTSVGNDSHDHTRITERGTISYGAGWLQWTDQSGNGGAGTNGTAPANPTNEWWHHLIMNHANSAGYYVDIAAAFHSDDIYFRRNVAGNLQSWRELWHSGNFNPASYLTTSGKAADANLLDGINSSSFLRSDATDLYNPARLDFGSTGNWDGVGYGSMTNLHFRDHNQFWIGAGNGTWFTGTANQKSQTSGLAADASRAHDLLITTMESTSTYDRGITFAVDSNAAGTGGWRLGKWHSGINQASSMLAVNGQIHAKGGHTDSTDYYADDYSTYYDDGQGGWGGDGGYGWHKPSIVAAKAIQIQSGTGTTNSAKPQIQFHQYGYGGPVFQYDGPNNKFQFYGPTSRLDGVQFNTHGVTNGLIVNYDQVYSPSRTMYINASATTDVVINSASGGNTTFRRDVYGRSVNGAWSSLYRWGGLYFTWDSDSYGTNSNHSIRSTYGDSWGDHITLNSFGHIRMNIDSNNNGSNNFEIGRHTTGTGNTLFQVTDTGQTNVYTPMTVSGGALTIDTNTVNRMRLYTEQGTGRIADTFADNSTFKSYIYFDQGTSSNDPGYIMHETSDSETNEGVLHLVPSDDNAYGDYVSIHGTNDPDVLRLHTDGTIEGVNNLSASGTITAGGNKLAWVKTQGTTLQSGVNFTLSSGVLYISTTA